MRQEIKRLIGARLDSIDLSADKVTVTLKTDRGVMRMEAEGDCCSRSWFAVVEPDDWALGHKVTAFDFNDIDAVEQQDGELKIYFGTIKTETGRIDMEMRNASNGYYGGTVVVRWEE